MTNNNRATQIPAIRLTLVLFLAGIGLSACGNGQDPEQQADVDETATKEDAAPAIPVEVAPTRRGEIYAAYSGSAALEAFEEATVVAKVEGEVASIEVEEGSFVKAGQVLARLDGDRLRLRVEQARANLAKAERDYKRNVDLHEKGLVASGAFEAIKYDMDALRAAFNIAKLEYDYSTIRAPIDGVVSSRMIKVGNTISVNTPCFHIADLTPLVAYMHVPEREFGKLQPGQQVVARIDALQAELFRGQIARISPLVDAETGTFKATIEMDPLDSTLKPGMFARLSIIYDTRPDALLVPRAALTETELGDSVYVVVDSKVERRPVKTGFSWRDELEIVDGLSDNEQVVIVGQAALKDGSEVNVVGLEPETDLANEQTDEDEALPEQSAATATASHSL